MSPELERALKNIHAVLLQFRATPVEHNQLQSDFQRITQMCSYPEKKSEEALDAKPAA